jgi:carboxyl-terminal processing protease
MYTDNNLPPLRTMAHTRRPRWALSVLFLSIAVVLFASGFALGHFGIPGGNYIASVTLPESARQFRIFWEAWQKIEQEFYFPTPLNPQAMTYGAIHGMVASLGDPFTSFVEPAEHRLESDTFKGDFGGIGASLVLADTQPTVVEVYLSSPAEVAGLQLGDRVLAVDGTETAGLLLDQVVLLIRGPLDSPVRLDVQRVGGDRVSLTILRQRVEMPSLTWQLLSDGIGYVGIHLFSARTGEELARAIQELQAQRVGALVLDLRDNGGGLTGGAIDVLRCLLGYGIAFREVRRGGDEQRYAVPFSEPLVDWPLAVLVDGRSASAAEMVAAAIRDYERGVLIGQRTFGKGSVQGMYPLGDGSSVHVTISEWLSAKGYPIDGVGLEPDIVAAPTAVSEAEDFSLRRAVSYLQQKIGRISTGSIAPLRSHDTGKVMV